MNILRLPIALVLACALLVIAKETSAQTTIIHGGGGGSVTHVYPGGVTAYQNGGNRVYVHGGHAGPGTCYRECFHQGRQTVIVQQPQVVVVNPGYHRPRSSFSFGFSAYDHRGSGASFGFTQVR